MSGVYTATALRSVRFVDTLDAGHDVNGNPEGVHLLRTARGRIIATLAVDYGDRNADDVARRLSLVLGREVRAGVTSHGTGIRAAARILREHGGEGMRLPADRYRRSYGANGYHTYERLSAVAA